MIGNKYDPRNKQYDELLLTFACGQTTFEELIEDLKPDKNKDASRQSWIITGPRGAGKSHLITLLYRTITQDATLSQAYHPLIFPEELFHVDSLYRLLIVIFEELFHTLPATNQTDGYRKKLREIKSKRLKGSQKEKKEQKESLAKELLDLLLNLRKDTHKKFIFFLENLQSLLRGQIPLHDQKILRAFLNENEQVFIIIGTALTLFNEIENYGKPFYHFFRIRSLAALDKNGIQTFIKKIARFYSHDEINAKIEANRHYINTYNILTGGNPRLVLFLYELLMDNDQLNTQIILEKVSELTPYFLDKMQIESPQRKLILDALVTGSPAQTATEISDYINEDQKSITEQLKRLCAEGWIKQIQLQAKDIKKKEVFYTLRDYFYRIWYQSRTGRIDQSEVYCLAELTTLLFGKKEIQDRLKRHKKLSSPQRPIYEKAWELVNTPKYIDNIELMVASAKQSEDDAIKKIGDEIQNCYSQKDWNSMLKLAEKLLEFPSKKADAHYLSGLTHYILNESEKAIECFQNAIDIKPDYHNAWFNMGNSYTGLNKFEKAIECYQKIIDIKPDYHKAWLYMGNRYAALNNSEEAIECYKKTIDIKPDYHKAWFNMGNRYAALNDSEKAIECFQNAIDIKPDYYDAWFNMGNRYTDLNKFEKAIECYKNVSDIKPDDHEAWFNMGNRYYKLKDYYNFHLSFLHHIQYSPSFYWQTFKGIQKLNQISDSLFSATQSLHTLVKTNSSLDKKLEAVGQLILLNKFSTIIDTFDPLLKEDLPEKETKVISFFLQGILLDMLANGKNSEDVNIFLKYWIMLNVKMQHNQKNKFEKVFFEFILLYIKIAGKENLSLDIIDAALDELYDQGIEMSDVLLSIIQAIKEPDSRNAQKWMADPLFKTIVTHPALTEKDEIE